MKEKQAGERMLEKLGLKKVVEMLEKTLEVWKEVMKGRKTLWKVSHRDVSL